MQKMPVSRIAVDEDRPVYLGEPLKNPFGVILLPEGTRITQRLKKTLLELGVENVQVRGGGPDDEKGMHTD